MSHQTTLGSFKRIAIVGTAGSWKQTPFNDVDTGIYSLNDAYRLPGFPRADFWADFHPLNKYFLVPETADGKSPAIYAHQIPVDQYVRPASHLDWLAQQPFPKFLHPDFATQYPAAATWPQAFAFPKAEIEAHFGTYFTSSPGWMLAHAVLEGVTDIAIYGIHLSTEHEYIDQRPNFEFLIGCVLGPGKRTVTIADGMRTIETAQGRIALPIASPVLQADFQYAFEPSPRRKLEPLRWELHKAQAKLGRRMEALKHAKAYWPFVTVQDPHPEETITRRLPLSSLQQEIRYYEAMVADCHEQLARVGVH